MNVDTLTIDPLLMNIVHRVGQDSTIEGRLTLQGGALIQGHIRGDIRIEGPLLVWSGATVHGRIHVAGDLYLFGTIGLSDSLPTDTTLECDGTAHVASSATINGTLKARHLNIYQGADLRGTVRSYERSKTDQSENAFVEVPTQTSSAIGVSVDDDLESFFKSPGVDVPVFSR